LLRSHACVIKPHLIYEVTIAIRARSPSCCRDRIDDGSKVTLACSPCHLRLLSVLDIRAGTVPAHDLASIVAEGLSANEKPPVNAIMAAKTRLDFVWFS